MVGNVLLRSPVIRWLINDVAFNTHVTGSTAARVYVLATFSVTLVSPRAWAASATEQIKLGTRSDFLYHRAKQSESSLVYL